MFEVLQSFTRPLRRIQRFARALSSPRKSLVPPRLEARGGLKLASRAVERAITDFTRTIGLVLTACACCRHAAPPIPSSK
jgi:hypothetical protein